MSGLPTNTGPIRTERRGWRGNGNRRGRGGARQPVSNKQDSTTPALALRLSSTTAVTLITEAPLTRPLSPTSGAVSSVRFADYHARGLICDQLFRNIPYEYCTQVQAATLEPILEGNDVLARAKTGTGKTMAFLIPIVENLLGKRASNPASVSTLVISPTRELAMQIVEEAQKLLNGLNIGVQYVVGGTNINSERKRLETQRTDILVATPGRLKDHIANSKLSPKLASVCFFVLDEADRLLDAGFRPEIESIIRSLPDRSTRPRQTLLFSATVSPEVRRIATLALLPQHRFISTVAETDESTHEHVPQTYSLIERSSHFATVTCYLEKHAASQAHPKVIVFLPTAREAALWGTLFEMLKPADLVAFQIHSRLSQPARIRATDNFKNAERAIMFASDVIARGIDISGITSVVQVGVPANTEQYVHRLGRTARAGESGEGLLILDPSESFFLNKLDNGIIKMADPELMSLAEVTSWQQKVNTALDTIPDDIKGQTYAAWMGYQNGLCKQLRWSKTQLVQNANMYATEVLRYTGDGANRLPPITAKAVGMMALREQRPLMNVVSELPGKERGGTRAPRQGGTQGAQNAPKPTPQLRGGRRGGQSSRGRTQ